MKGPRRYQTVVLWFEVAGDGFYARYAGGSRWCPNRGALMAWLKWPKGPSRDALTAWLDEIESPPAVEAVEQDPTANTRTII